MRKKVSLTPFVAALLVLGTGLPASAASVSFNFNSLASGAGPSSIQTYMNAQLALVTPALTVSSPTGAITDKGYNGDGHVVGIGANRDSLTLGTSENGVYNGDFSCSASGCTGPLDTFVRNNSSATQWTFAFMGGMIIDSVRFDYEIFPDASGNTPDMTFRTNLGEVFHYYGVTPTSPNNDSPLSLTESTKQLIGNTGILTGPMISGANSLTFIDWPVTIGIDNLTIDYHTNGVAPVPEPASMMLLLGSGLAAAYARRKKRQATV